MAITVKHKFVSAIPDGTDATVVRPSNWNDDHDLVGTVPVANGGTGVSTSSGANSVVLRDASNNITANALDDAYTNTAASGTAITLTVASPRRYTITGSGGQTIKLPDATTLLNGAIFEFDNNQSSGAITVNNNSNTLVVSVPSGGIVRVNLLSNAIAAGSWDRHDLTPANVSWSTNTLDYAGSITSATWNGVAVAINRGGTGQATATAGFNALAPSQTSNSGKYLTTDGTNASWATVSGGGVTSITAGSGLSGGTITTSGTIALDINGLASTTVVANDLVPVYDVSASANADCLASDIAGLGSGAIGYKTNNYYFPYMTGNQGGLSLLSTNRIYYVPFFVRQKTTFTRIGIQVTTFAGTSARLGIYNAANGVPTSLLLNCGTVSTASNGDKEATISQSLNVGFYFLALVCDNSPTIQILGLSVASSGYAIGQTARATIAYALYADNGSITLPNPAQTSLTELTANIPAVSLRVV
jgi:hypothetical protein